MLGEGRPEQDHRRAAECAGQVRGTGVCRDNEIGVGNDREEILQRDLPGRHPHLVGDSVVDGDRRIGGFQCPAPFVGIPGEEDIVPGAHQMNHHLSETRGGPVAAGVGSTDMDDHAARSATDLVSATGWRSLQMQVGGVSIESVCPYQPGPAFTLVEIVTPRRALPAGCSVAYAQTRAEAVQPTAAFRSIAVQVHRDIDAAVGDCQREIQPVGRQDSVHAADQLDDRSEPGPARHQQVVVGQPPAQSPQSGHGNEQVAELQGPQHHRIRSVHDNPLPSAVLFDRDDTLIADVPYNGDPDKVRPLPGVADALGRLRRLGIPLGVVSNQSGVGRGLLTMGQVGAVNDRVSRLLGPFDVWAFCPHTDEDACACRKPAPGLVTTAAHHLGVIPSEVVVIGDIGADMLAAKAAGAEGILVPTGRTRQEEIDAAPRVAANLSDAVSLALGERRERS